MKTRAIVFLTGMVMTVLLGSSLYAAENVSESSLAYRRATLEALVTESQLEKKYPRRHFPHELPYFQNADSPNLMELEPVGRSTGDVVGA